MSYLRKTEYEIVLRESFPVIRNCPGCGKKTHFRNTEKFRVNANGNKLDVWLIYQCEECRHTLNLAIYERQKVASIPKKEYECFLDNDRQLAERYGKDLQLFRRNKAKIDLAGVDYDLVRLHETIEGIGSEGQDCYIFYDPYGLKARPEKLAAMVSGMARSQVNKRMEQGKVKAEVIRRI